MQERIVRGWDVVRVYAEPASLRMFFFGFSSGLPLLLVLGTLSFWLREAEVDLKTIGFLSWVGLVYGFKWVWAPAIDRVRLPFLTARLGRRRAWLVVAQTGIVGALIGLSQTDPAASLAWTAVWALLTAFASATQDIALDAYRIESAQSNRQAALAAMYQTGYRIAMIWSGAGALAVAAWAQSAEGYEPGAWSVSYLVMAVSASVGLVTSLLAPEPETTPGPRVQPSAAALFEPFADFFRRFGRWATVVLLLIATYRISDVVMGIMANPFYQDLGFTKQEVAAVSKVFGVVMTLAGAFAGGAEARRQSGALHRGTPFVPDESAFCRTRRHRAESRISRRRRFGRQSRGGLGERRVRGVPLGPDIERLLGDAVRALQLADVAFSQIFGGLFGRGGGNRGVLGLFRGDVRDRRARGASGVACGAGRP